MLLEFKVDCIMCMFKCICMCIVVALSFLELYLLSLNQICEIYEHESQDIHYVCTVDTCCLKSICDFS